ncbi:MAG: DegT/DnrJ/EryC1/StrS family aminotransferase [Planctomycetales bacterium]|nr:DegT/DnrJ/EryC1/StrS family aminotransferase [Planctomycetales bacterium]
MTSPTQSLPVPMLDVTRQNAPLLADMEAAIADVCRSGAFVHGPACRQFEQEIADYCGVGHAVGCASGSDALILPLMALEIGPGDEVIIPSFTFFATAGAVARLGATPVFADILPETFNIDPADVARKMTRRTKAIIPVHLFGQCADMAALTAAAGKVPLIEDAAQAIGAEYGDLRAGALGWCGAFSFYPTKNLGGCGDGGVVTTDDGDLAERLRILRDHGQHPRYHHHVVGMNSRLDSLQAAVLSVKLKRLDAWALGRQANAERYEAAGDRFDFAPAIELPTVAEGCRSVWNQYTVRVPSDDGTSRRRDALQKLLADRKIGAAIYYPIPLHLQECFAALGYGEGDLPESERAAREVLSLPIYGEMTAAEQEAVIAALAQFAAGEAAATGKHAA